MKWWIISPILALCAALGFVLSGCANAGGVDTEGKWVDLPDGKKVLCVVALETSAGGTAMSCDWSTVR